MGKIIRRCLTAAVVMIIVGCAISMIITAVKGPNYLNEFLIRLTQGRIVNVTEWLSRWEDEAKRGGEALQNMLSDDGSGYEIEDSMNFDRQHQTVEKDVNESFYDIRTLELELGGCDFYALTSEDKDFHVWSENVGKIQIYEKNNGLHLTAIRKTGTDISPSKIYLEIPADADLKEVSLELGAGNVSLESLSAREVDLEVGAGRITADRLQADELSINIGAGEVRLEEMNTGELEVSVGAGNFQGQGTVRGDVNLECAMGNLGLALAGSETDFDYELECVAGNIQLGDSQFKSLAVDKKINNHASKKMELECSMGAITVEFYD